VNAAAEAKVDPDAPASQLADIVGPLFSRAGVVFTYRAPEPAPSGEEILSHLAAMETVCRGLMRRAEDVEFRMPPFRALARGMTATLGGLTFSDSEPLTLPRDPLHWLPVRGLDLSRFPVPIVIESKAGDPYPGHEEFTIVQLRATMRVNDRDAPERQVEVRFGRNVRELELRSRGEEEILYDIVRQALEHELRECWLVGGARVRDPHRGDPQSYPLTAPAPSLDEMGELFDAKRYPPVPR
jgi:hypothetical protein